MIGYSIFSLFFFKTGKHFDLNIKNNFGDVIKKIEDINYEKSTLYYHKKGIILARTKHIFTQNVTLNFRLVFKSAEPVAKCFIYYNNFNKYNTYFFVLLIYYSILILPNRNYYTMMVLVFLFIVFSIIYFLVQVFLEKRKIAKYIEFIRGSFQVQ
jgi:hypothetical protein